MPHPTKRSAHAKVQRCQGDNKFISPQYSDSASEHLPSSAKDSLDSYKSSDKSDTAVHQLYQKALPAAKKQKPVLKAPYTGDSHATKHQRQSYWKKASSGCRQIAGFFQVSPIIEFQEDHRVIHK